MKDSKIIIGGDYTRRLAANDPYTADGDANPYVVGFYAPDPSTVFTTVNNNRGESLITKMGLNIAMEVANPPIERSNELIAEIQADKPIVLILASTR